MASKRGKKVNSSSDHRKDILCKLNEYRLSRHLCDVMLDVQGREFPAHRAVLAAGGGFFTGLFAAKMKEQSESKVQLQEVEADVMDDVLSFIYTGEINLTRESVEPVLVAADFLLLDELKSIADEWLANAVKDNPPNDCFLTYQFALRYKCDSLEEVALKLVCENFEKALVQSRDTCMELSVETLENIICNDDVLISSEEIIFSAVVDWAKYKESRKAVFPRLFSHVRLCSLSEEFICQSVRTEDLVTGNPECLQMIKQKCLTTMYEPTTANQEHPRSCLDNYADVIQVFPKSEVYCEVTRGPWCYVPSENKWYHFAPNDFIYEGFEGWGLPVNYNRSLFLVEQAEDSWDIRIHHYDLETNDWTVAVEQTGSHGEQDLIRSFGVACLKGIVYIIGGKLPCEDIGHWRSLALVYACDVTVFQESETESNDIVQTTPMNECRTNACIAADDNYLYVLGGYCYGQDIYTQTVERYDPSSKVWQYLSPMKYNARHDQCTLANGKIFVSQVSSDESSNLGAPLEVYDIRSDTWAEISGPPLPSENMVMTFCNHKLYLMSATSRMRDDDVFKKIYEDCGFHPPLELQSMSYDFKKHAWTPQSSIRLKMRENKDAYDIVELGGTVTRLPKKAIAECSLLEDVDPADFGYVIFDFF